MNFTYTKGPEAANTEAVILLEGATGWADTWMISALLGHPNCMLKWMDCTLQPDVQAEVGLDYGAAGLQRELVCGARQPASGRAARNS